MQVNIIFIDDLSEMQWDLFPIIMEMEVYRDVLESQGTEDSLCHCSMSPVICMTVISNILARLVPYWTCH